MDGSRCHVSDAVFERIAHAFVDAYNRRDPERWVALFHPEAEFHPTLLIGSRSVYRGHEGVRRYLDELGHGHMEQQARVREIRRVAADRFVLLTDVLDQGKVVSPAAVLLRLEDDKIIAATAYLSDDETLISLGLIPQVADRARTTPRE